MGQFMCVMIVNKGIFLTKRFPGKRAGNIDKMTILVISKLSYVHVFIVAARSTTSCVIACESEASIFNPLS